MVFFEPLAFSIMVRNGDAHLKNFGLLYRSAEQVWLAPMFVVVTTSIYTDTQYACGPELEDRNLALKLFAGKHHTKAYPTKEELEDFDRRVCGVRQPAHILGRIVQALHSTMEKARSDPRVPKALWAKMAQARELGDGYAR